MLALAEKPRTVVLLWPHIKLSGKDKEIVAKLEDCYLEVKARKEIYLTQADAEHFLHFLPLAERQVAVESATRGLSEVLVLEHLEGDAIERMLAMQEEMAESLGEDSRVYCSSSVYDAVRDLEYFFPHLDALPVERTLALIKPDAISRELGGSSLRSVVEEEVAAAGLFVVGTRELLLDKELAACLCEDIEDTPEYNGTMGVLQGSEGALAMCLEGRGAINKWRLLCGPTSSDVARAQAPTTIRARWGTDSTSNAVHCSSCMQSADRELKALFPEGALQLQRTLCIVKPDAMPTLLQIRMMIEDAGFTVLKEKQVTLTADRAEEFYRELKSAPSFGSMIKEACAGPCCIMVLCRLEAVSVLQQLMGPERVDEAQARKPTSIRALYGHEGQKNAVHGSANIKAATREVQFFFPELGRDPVPGDDEVRDFLFRKSSRASMDLKNLPEAGASNDFAVDPTLQQLLSRGLMALCQVQPKGLNAVKWLSRWLDEHNPNKSETTTEVQKFSPPERTKKFIEYGVNEDGIPFAVEPPPAKMPKPVVEVDVSEEPDALRKTRMKAPPFVVFVLGGPGSGKGTQCTRLKEQFNFVHLSTGDLMREEVASQTFLGTEIFKHMQTGSLVPDEITVKLLKKTMLKYQDTNRFLLDGFPRTVEQAKIFEQEIAEVAFCLYFEAGEEVMKQRIMERAASSPGRVDDNEETVANRLQVFAEETMPVVSFYGPIGKLRTCNAEQSVEEVFVEAKRYFSCRFVYLLGPLGCPLVPVAERLEQKYGYCCINVPALLQEYAESKEEEAGTVKRCLATGKPVDPAIVCPLVLKEVAKGQTLGRSSFLLCDFPQTLKQAQFIEYRVPSTSKALLLDFSRADAEDLSATLPLEYNELEVETRISAFFGAETQEMLKSLPGLERIPLNFEGKEPLPPGATSLDAAGVEQQLISAACEGVVEKIQPGLTLVLGLPCSGTTTLAHMLAGMVPNTQCVDCNQLLDKELERKTDVGLEIQRMLSRGQVVPLSVSLELLKNVAGLTCSDSMVVENCPMYADQIEHLEKEFRIDRVFYIAGDSKAQHTWKMEYVETGATDDEKTALAKAFDEKLAGLEPITAYFSRLGRVERFDVSETPSEKQFASMIEQATMPQFTIFTGPSEKFTPAEAEKLAVAYSAGVPITAEKVVEWAKTGMSETIDPAQPSQFLPALKKFAESNSAPFLVLDRYPKTSEDAAAFADLFGPPKIVVHIGCDVDYLVEEFGELNPDAETEEEELRAKFEADQQATEAMLKTLEEKCPGCLLSLNQATTPSADMGDLIKKRLMPQVYALVCPAQFAGVVADVVSAKGKYTILDSAQLLSSGGHSPELEAQLTKALRTAEAPDALPAQLWSALFQEAFAKAANPMGTFLVTNFPTASAVRSSPTVRDQFCMLDSIAVLSGIMHVTLSETAFAESCSTGDGAWEEYSSFDQAVKDQTIAQFSESRIHEVSVADTKSLQGAAEAVAKQFLEFRSSAAEA